MACNAALFAKIVPLGQQALEYGFVHLYGVFLLQAIDPLVFQHLLVIVQYQSARIGKRTRLTSSMPFLQQHKLVVARFFVVHRRTGATGSEAGRYGEIQLCVFKSAAIG